VCPSSNCASLVAVAAIAIPPAATSALASTRIGAGATRYRKAAATEPTVNPTVARPKTSDSEPSPYFVPTRVSRPIPYSLRSSIVTSAALPSGPIRKLTPIRALGASATGL